MCEKKAQWSRGYVEQVRAALTCCALEWEEHGAAEEAEMEDAHKKGFIPLMLGPFHFQNI